MRYLVSAKIKPGCERDLERALDDRSFGGGFPYGDLGETLREGRVDAGGTIRWVEVCYCREAYGVALDEELPYFEQFLTEITIVDARSPRGCTGYPDCSGCDCTRKVQPKGEPFVEYLRRASFTSGSDVAAGAPGRPTRWLGWRGETTPEEALRNEAGRRAEMPAERPAGHEGGGNSSGASPGSGGPCASGARKRKSQ